MNPALPIRLKEGLETLLEGVSRTELAVRSAAITARYRSGAASDLAVTSDLDALAYAVARLPATYAVAAAIMDQIHTSAPDFTPASILDVGAGPGTASWAAHETWSGLNGAVLVDSNPHFLALARALAAVPATEFRAADVSTASFPSADLVVAGYVLAELAQHRQRPLIENLLVATGDVLALVEPGTPAGFERLRAARIVAIARGFRVLGPCTHGAACPIAAPDWCHFTQRLPRSRDHLRAKEANVPFEDERYAWLAVRRTGDMPAGQSRILAPPVETKPGIALKLCSEGGLEQRFVARRDKAAFVRARRLRWGDVV